jgi:hypothetical protein
MPIDIRRDPRLIAVMFATVALPRGAARDTGTETRLADVSRRVNQAFAPALAEPFGPLNGGELQGALSDPAQAPLCVSLLREWLAPTPLRVGIGIGAVEPGADESGRDPFEQANAAVRLAEREHGVTRYLGCGQAADILLNAICRLLDPLIMERTDKQWEAIAAYRRLGHQRAVAIELGVTRQSVGDRMAAGHRRETQEADTAIAAFLAHVRRP